MMPPIAKRCHGRTRTRGEDDGLRIDRACSLVTAVPPVVAARRKKENEEEEEEEEEKSWWGHCVSMCTEPPPTTSEETRSLLEYTLCMTTSRSVCFVVCLVHRRVSRLQETAEVIQADAAIAVGVCTRHEHVQVFLRERTKAQSLEDITQHLPRHEAGLVRIVRLERLGHGVKVLDFVREQQCREVVFRQLVLVVEQQLDVFHAELVVEDAQASAKVLRRHAVLLVHVEELKCRANLVGSDQHPTEFIQLHGSVTACSSDACFCWRRVDTACVRSATGDSCVCGIRPLRRDVVAP